MRIKVTSDGPYVVTGGVPLSRAAIAVDDGGDAVGWTDLEHFEVADHYTLCRCGRSNNKPWCDGSHASTGFDGTETAGHRSYAEMDKPVSGPGVVLHDAVPLCASARFCLPGGKLWHLVERAPGSEERALAVEEAMLCPAGRYVLEDDAIGHVSEPEFEPSIVLIEDPQMGVSGPIFVRGGVEIVDANGEPYEVRNRVTLCRCGASRNMPFCDGSHISAGFKDDSAY